LLLVTSIASVATAYANCVCIALSLALFQLALQLPLCTLSSHLLYKRRHTCTLLHIIHMRTYIHIYSFRVQASTQIAGNCHVEHEDSVFGAEVTDIAPSISFARARTSRETSANKKAWSENKCSFQKCFCT